MEIERINGLGKIANLTFVRKKIILFGVLDDDGKIVYYHLIDKSNKKLLASYLQCSNIRKIGVFPIAIDLSNNNREKLIEFNYEVKTLKNSMRYLNTKRITNDIRKSMEKSVVEFEKKLNRIDHKRKNLLYLAKRLNEK